MKKLLLFLLFASFATAMNAQSSIKAGVNYYSDYIDHKLGKFNYIGYEACYERSISKKISLTASYTYTKINYKYPPIYESLVSGYFGNRHSVTNYHSIVLGACYYLPGVENSMFFTAGIPFTYMEERTFYANLHDAGSVVHASYAISTIVGLGIKHSFTKKLGAEININFSPSFNMLGIDYGSSGFIRSGIMVTYSFN